MTNYEKYKATMTNLIYNNCADAFKDICIDYNERRLCDRCPLYSRDSIWEWLDSEVDNNG